MRTKLYHEEVSEMAEMAEMAEDNGLLNRYTIKKSYRGW